MSKSLTRRRRDIRVLSDSPEAVDRRRRMDRIFSRGMYPLDSPGMPPPGPDFLREAMALGDTTVYEKGSKKKAETFTPGGVLRRLYRAALRQPGFTMGVQVREGVIQPVSFIPGHIWGQHAALWAKSQTDASIEVPPVDGPHPARVMVLGKMPWRDEMREGRNLIGTSGEILLDMVRKFHLVNEAQHWYVTTLVKFMPPDDTTTLKSGWIKDCLPLLAQELRIVRPDYILCLGADASKALLGAEYGVSYMAGRVVPYTFSIGLPEDEEPQTHTAQVMTVLHPAEVSRSPEKVRILASNFGRFAFLLSGADFSKPEDVDHRACYDLESATDWVQEAEDDLRDVPRRLRLIGIDLEWQGQHPVNPGTYVRTIQLSWADKKSICFVLHEAGGKIAFRDREGKPAIKRLVCLLNAFMEGKRAVGHFLVSDLEWAHSLGFYPEASAPIPLFPDDKGRLAWERLRRGEGWLDTAMMNHAIEETAPLGLESLAMRYTQAPRYDIPLEDWKKNYCHEKKLKGEALEGYGDCPDDVLIPYANYDADVTRRICVQLMGLLDSDYEGNCAWEPFWESMIIQPVIIDIHENGILVDRARADDLTRKFIKAREAKETEIRSWAKWPEFNVRSTLQVREFLFGEQYNGKRDDRGNSIRLRPKEARSLYIKPLLDTSKPPRRWSDLEERGLDRHANPGTGKMVLGILAQENMERSDQVNMVRDYRFLDQVLKSVLRVPKVDEDDMWVENDEGFLEYDKGLVAAIDFDGRVRTHIYPTAETGRWKHSRPNLANISKRRDPDYVRLLGGTKNEKGKWVGGDYTHKLRSILRATPGYVFVEFDYIGAELAIMAIKSGSKRMMDHCRRALLDDEGYDEKGNKVKGGKFPDPDYYDIHSNVAVLAFQLKCPATKAGLDSIGKAHFRVLAKNVIFGIAYGRGAKAIALAAREEGVKITAEDAQRVIDAIFSLYPELVPLFEEAKSRAINEKWLRNDFGRYRRFPTASDYKLEGEFERQAMNFGIQGDVASMVNRGLAFLRHAIYEQELQDDVRILLQIHDAGLVECRPHLVKHVKALIRWAMIDMVEIWPTNQAGKPRGDGPYHLGLDFAVEYFWGQPLTLQEKEELDRLSECST